MTKLLGMIVETDYEPLTELLKCSAVMAGGDMGMKLIEQAFPGFLAAVLQCKRELESKNLRPLLVTYYSLRVQAWAMGFDADPSSFYRVVPYGVTTEMTSVH